MLYIIKFMQLAAQSTSIVEGNRNSAKLLSNFPFLSLEMRSVPLMNRLTKLRLDYLVTLISILEHNKLI